MTMVKTFKEFIAESIWSEIQDRSSGKIERNEDDINSFCLEDFAEYLYQHYEITERCKNFYNIKDIISVCGDKTSLIIQSFHTQSYLMPLVFEESDKGCEISIYDYIDFPSHLLDLMREEFIMTERVSEYHVSIRPKHGKVDKKFFVSVLDFIIDNVESPEWTLLKRKDDVI